MSILKKIFGDPNKKALKRLQKTVDQINNLEPEFKKKNQKELVALTRYFQKKLAEKKSLASKEVYLNKILPQAFAAVREAAKHVLNQRHYDVQIIGALALHKGKIAEMKTGEGKTLAATMPAYLNALLGKGVHIVTVNDYLARRDASWMGQIYNFLGLKTACLQQMGKSFEYDQNIKKGQNKEKNSRSFEVDVDFLRPCSRKQSYMADITYGTNSEFGFDYLRDNMVSSLDQKTQKAHYYAIIDEVDSVLIDEARTPLIISAPDTKSASLYKKFAQLVPRLRENEDYNKDEERNAVSLTENGIQKMEKFLGVQNIYTEDVTLAHQLDQALKAYVLYKNDRDYVISNGEVVIVDQFTGRLMPGRRYSQGLHQAIEAKENVKIKQESKTLATISIQNYFRMYHKLAGMTGTAATEAEEFYKIYQLDVITVPANKPVIRKDKSDVIYKTEKAKFKALIEKVRQKHQSGQPVLIGTISIQKNEQLSDLLNKAGIKHQVLNAKKHEKEAQVIAQAGKLKAITVATNMAGRGVDIVLGGNPQDPVEAEKVKKLGGLCVLGSERHEARRIDNQLRGRSGRQGDPGESQFFISLEDDLMRIFGSDRISSVMNRLGVPEDVPIENKIISRSIEKAQKRVEGYNFDIRKHLVEYDDVTNKQRMAIYERRNQVLEQEKQKKNLSQLIFPIIKKEIKRIIEFHSGKQSSGKINLKEIKEVLQSIPLKIDQQILKKKNFEDLNQAINNITNLAIKQYKKLSKELDPQLKINIEKTLLLRSIDTLWINHLDELEHLRAGIGLRGYGQRDPLVEYKREAYQMYQLLLREIEHQIVYNIYKIFIAYQKVEAQENISQQLKKAAMKVQALQPKQERAVDPYAGGRHVDNKGDNYIPKDRNPKTGKKVGRNDPCPCGSGKKYKKCCGK